MLAEFSPSIGITKAAMVLPSVLLVGSTEVEREVASAADAEFAGPLGAGGVGLEVALEVEFAVDLPVDLELDAEGALQIEPPIGRGGLLVGLAGVGRGQLRRRWRRCGIGRVLP